MAQDGCMQIGNMRYFMRKNVLQNMKTETNFILVYLKWYFKISWDKQCSLSLPLLCDYVDPTKLKRINLVLQNFCHLTFCSICLHILCEQNSLLDSVRFEVRDEDPSIIFPVGILWRLLIRYYNNAALVRITALTVLLQSRATVLKIIFPLK